VALEVREPRGAMDEGRVGVDQAVDGTGDKSCRGAGETLRGGASDGGRIRGRSAR